MRRVLLCQILLFFSSFSAFCIWRALKILLTAKEGNRLLSEGPGGGGESGGRSVNWFGW